MHVVGSLYDIDEINFALINKKQKIYNIFLSWLDFTG